MPETRERKWPLPYRSRTVDIGGLPLGGDHPVRIQSMTNTDTLDVPATVRQILSLASAGCELVRVATPGMREAACLPEIKKALIDQGILIPVAADIHFRPEVAIAAAEAVDKVRINPGNYSSKKASGMITDYGRSLEIASAEIKTLVETCRRNGTVIRVGVNHGSLSERIMERYGNTPEGMAESAMEFLRICRGHDFHDLVVSMKSSDVRNMIWSTRLLVSKMKEEGFDCPLHLGVTEAGEGEDGRLRSAIGIGALLGDGIGDTIRVSLTGDPMEEIPFAKELAGLYGRVRVEERHGVPHPFGHYPSERTGDERYKELRFPLVVSEKGEAGNGAGPDLVADREAGVLRIPTGATEYSFLKEDPDFHIYRMSDDLQEDRRRLSGAGYMKPVILRPDRVDLKSRVRVASLLIDGLADGAWLAGPARNLFDIYQASGLRTTRTQYIACPSCGRTRFDILRVLREIKQRTTHLPGLKIAVMGCIVNGPGEMADADYGYVGSGQGRVTLYKGKVPVLKNIPESSAIGEMITLIKNSGDWRDP